MIDGPEGVECRYGLFDYEYTHQCQGTTEVSLIVINLRTLSIFKSWFIVDLSEIYEVLRNRYTYLRLVPGSSKPVGEIEAGDKTVLGEDGTFVEIE